MTDPTETATGLYHELEMWARRFTMLRELPSYIDALNAKISTNINSNTFALALAMDDENDTISAPESEPSE